MKNVNQYNPSVIFMGHRKTVQIQIRHRIVSDQELHCLLTNLRLKFEENNTTNTPNIGNEPLRLIVMGTSFWFQRVNGDQ